MFTTTHNSSGDVTNVSEAKKDVLSFKPVGAADDTIRKFEGRMRDAKVFDEALRSLPHNLRKEMGNETHTNRRASFLLTAITSGSFVSTGIAGTTALFGVQGAGTLAMAFGVATVGTGSILALTIREGHKIHQKIQQALDLNRQ